MRVRLEPTLNVSRGGARSSCRWTRWTTWCWAAPRTPPSPAATTTYFTLFSETQRPAHQRHQRAAGLGRGEPRLRRGEHPGGHPALRPHGQPLGPGHAAQRRQLPGLRLRRHGRPRAVRHRALRRLLRDADDRLQRRGRHQRAAPTRPASPFDLSTVGRRHSLVLAVARRDTEQQAKAKLDGRAGRASTTACTSPTAPRRWDSGYGEPSDARASGSRQSGFVPRRGAALRARTCGCATSRRAFRLELEAAAQSSVDIDNRATDRAAGHGPGQQPVAEHHCSSARWLQAELQG